MTWRVKRVSPFNQVDWEKLLLNASLCTYVKFVSNRCVQPGKVVSRPANGYTTLTATHTSLYTQTRNDRGRSLLPREVSCTVIILIHVRSHILIPILIVILIFLNDEDELSRTTNSRRFFFFSSFSILCPPLPSLKQKEKIFFSKRQVKSMLEG